MFSTGTPEGIEIEIEVPASNQYRIDPGEHELTL